MTVETRQPNRTVIYTVALIAIPLVIAAINPIWLMNRAGDIDVWMYYGYFRHLYQFADQFVWPANAYIGTRIPYILPGYITHRIAGDALHHYVFNIAILYSTIALSFFYMLRKHLTLDVAAATVALILTNYFLLRSIGWDYVDKCVLAYEALTFAMLAWAPDARRPWVAMVAAGFFAASMLFVHIASAILFPIFLMYSGYVAQNLSTARQWREHVLRLALFGAAGAALAQILWGGLTVALHGGPFFFIMRQVNFVAPNLNVAWNYPTAVLIERGYWIIYHLAACIASLVAIVMVLTGRVRVNFNRFEWFVLWTATLFNGFLLVAEATKFMWLLSRDGVHSTIFIPITMMAYGVLLFRRASPALVFVVILAGVASVATLINIGQGTGLQAYLKVNMPTLAVAQAVVLVAAFLVRRTAVTAVAILIIGVLNAFATWHFQDDTATKQAHDRIAKNIVDSRVPKFFYDKLSGTQYVYPVWSLMGAFTDRTLWPSEEKYPLIEKDLNQGDIIVVASGTESNPNAVREVVMKRVKAADILDSFKSGGIWLHVLNVTQK